MRSAIALAITIFVVSGCGISIDSKTESSTLTYEFESNGCKTGKHSFSSRTAYCEGLKSYSLNNGCAYGLRKAEYERNCTGFFVEN